MTDVNTAEEYVQAPPRRPVKSKRGRQILTLILVVLFLLLIATSVMLVRLLLPQGKIASKEQSGGLEWVRSIYGWGKGANQMLTNPGTVAVAPDGTIWTTDSDRFRVVGFNSDGTYKATLSGTNKTKFISPTDLAVDPSGNLYVAENTANRVIVTTPGGQELRVIRVQTPTAVAASADRILVGSNGGFAILDKEGNPLKVIGQQGHGDTQFDRVNGLAIGNDGRIFVVDTYNNRISAYDANGKRLWIQVTGNPANQVNVKESNKPKPTKAKAALALPLQLTIDGRGRLVLIDAFDMSLAVFDPNTGNVIAKYGAFGTEDGKMMYPSGVAYDNARDWFAVADSNNQRLEVFRIPDSSQSSLMGALQRSLSGPLRACLVPLVILLLALVVWVIMRRRNRRRNAAVPVTPVDSASLEH